MLANKWEHLIQTPLHFIGTLRCQDALSIGSQRRIWKPKKLISFHRVSNYHLVKHMPCVEAEGGPFHYHHPSNGR